MIGFSRSLSPAKAGLVLIDPESGAIGRIIALQHNSETLSFSPPSRRRAKRASGAKRSGSRVRRSMIYRRAKVAGGTHFFAVNLAERKRNVLVKHVDLLGAVARKVNLA